MTSPCLLKLLCLHGYRQNDQVFKERTGSLRKILKKHCQFTYISAPNLIPESEEVAGWWFSKQDQSYLAQEVSECCDGFEASLSVVANALKESGPFDGVIAFSQGASLLSVICALKEAGDDRFQNFTFAIFFAGFKSQQIPHQVYYERVISIPSLHVIGDSDKVIPKEMSDELLEIFSNYMVVRHTGGHFVPTTAVQKKTYIEFLQPFLDKKKSESD